MRDGRRDGGASLPHLDGGGAGGRRQVLSRGESGNTGRMNDDAYSEPAFEPAAGGEVVVVVGAFHASFPSEPFPSAGVERPPAPAAGVPERLPIGAGTAVPDAPKRADDAGAAAAAVAVVVVLVGGGGAGEVPLWYWCWYCETGYCCCCCE